MSAPWMPLYVADYLKDTGHLSAAEHGAYLLLIMHYWSTGGLPKEDRRLAAIARMSPKEWSESRDTIAEFFGDGWKHGRIERQLLEAGDAYNRRALPRGWQTCIFVQRAKEGIVYSRYLSLHVEQIRTFGFADILRFTKDGQKQK